MPLSPSNDFVTRVWVIVTDRYIVYELNNASSYGASGHFFNTSNVVIPHHVNVTTVAESIQEQTGYSSGQFDSMLTQIL